MIVVPMFTHFRSARNVIGLMLLLLFSTDVFSLRHYWNRWHRQSVTRLILGSLLGIALASLILKDISDYHLKKVIGGIACLFALLEFLRPYWQWWLGDTEQSVEAAWNFKTWQGLLAGLFAGVFSTLAHMGGLVCRYVSPPSAFREYRLRCDHDRYLFLTQLHQDPVLLSTRSFLAGDPHRSRRAFTVYRVRRADRHCPEQPGLGAALFEACFVFLICDGCASAFGLMAVCGSRFANCELGSC